MDKKLSNILYEAQSEEIKVFQRALNDLKYLIERVIQNRFTDKDNSNYLVLFYDKNLINYKIDELDIEKLKYYLFYVLFNFADRIVLAAKCIKVLGDINSRNAICAAIEYYMYKDDDATCELMLAITDVGDYNTFFSNERILDLFKLLANKGLNYSKQNAIETLDFYKQNWKDISE